MVRIDPHTMTMTPYGEMPPEKPQFFWQDKFQGIGIGIPQPEHCVSCPGGHANFW